VYVFYDFFTSIVLKLRIAINVEQSPTASKLPAASTTMAERRPPSEALHSKEIARLPNQPAMTALDDDDDGIRLAAGGSGGSGEQQRRSKRSVVGAGADASNGGLFGRGSFTADLRDPFQLLALAVQVDESSPHAERFLSAPAESGGSLHSRPEDGNSRRPRGGGLRPKRGVAAGTGGGGDDDRGSSAAAAAADDEPTTTTFADALEYLRSIEASKKKKRSGGGGTTTDRFGENKTPPTSLFFGSSGSSTSSSSVAAATAAAVSTTSGGTSSGGATGNSAKKTKKSSATSASSSSSTTSSSGATGAASKHPSQPQPPKQQQQKITKPPPPTCALTPVILSGLLAAIQQQQQQQQQSTGKRSKGNDDGIADDDQAATAAISSELVLSCQTWRRAALYRVRRRRRVRRLQKVVLPAALLAVLAGECVQNAIRQRRVRTELRYVLLPEDGSSRRSGSGSSSFSSCKSIGSSPGSNNNNSSYEAACRIAEAELWESYGDYLSELKRHVDFDRVNCVEPPFDPRCDHAVLWQRRLASLPKAASTYSATSSASLDGGGAKMPAPPIITASTARQLAAADANAEAPFAMHTTLAQNKFTLEEIKRGRRLPAKLARKSGKIWPTRDGRPRTFAASYLQWLGSSHANRLVRETVEFHLGNKSKKKKKKKKSNQQVHWDVLDAGCGVGGTMYALMPDNSFQKLSYHGIALSASEIYHAEQFYEFHRKAQTPAQQQGSKQQRSGSTTELAEVKFEQRSFDDPALSDRQYSAIVAIDSIGYSNNARDTVTNLMRSLKRGGVFIVVDDVVLGREQRRFALEAAPIMQKLGVLTYTAWWDILVEAGCEMNSARDLSLEYEMPNLLLNNYHDIGIRQQQSGGYDGKVKHSVGNSRAGAERWFSLSSISSWRYYLSGWPWEWGFRRNIPDGEGDITESVSPVQRMIQLARDRNDLVAAKQKRQEEYTVYQSLSYYMFVCSKK